MQHLFLILNPSCLKRLTSLSNNETCVQSRQKLPRFNRGMKLPYGRLIRTGDQKVRVGKIWTVWTFAQKSGSLLIEKPNMIKEKIYGKDKSTHT
jgi:hypothetical protein